jgi:hypothetical protein
MSGATVPGTVPDAQVDVPLTNSAAIPVLVLLLAGCGTRGTLSGNLYRDGAVAFRIGAHPPAWRRVQIAHGPLAFPHHYGGTILAHVTCEARADPSLDVLTNHQLFGIEEARERSRTPLSLDGRRALRTRVDGALDGVPIALDLVVLKKDSCTYDLELASSPEMFARRQPDFERFFMGFARVSS